MSWLVRPFVLFLRYWPQLAACYLLGLLGRNGAIWLAAWAGWDNDLWASLIMPLAGIARLGSYVAMFFVLRPAIPGIAALPHRSARSVDLFSSVILPFFAIYLAWQMFREDWLAFEVQALDYRMADSITNPGQPEIDPENLPVSTTTWVVIGIALVARFVLSRYSEVAGLVCCRPHLRRRAVGLPGFDILGQPGSEPATEPCRLAGRAPNRRVVQPYP